MSAQTASDYVSRATSLRQDGRLEEALLAARKATSLAPDDANAWWQLALAMQEHQGLDSAKHSLERVTELAPGFEGGWHELGRCHHVGGRLEEAVAAYEAALSVEPEYMPTLRMLSYALKQLDPKGTQARRLSMLRLVYLNGKLDAEDTFDLAYLLGEAKEYAEAASIYERYTQENTSQVAYFNLALCYRRMDRDLDALDALFTAKRAGYDDEGLDTVLEAVQTKLTALRTRVLLSPRTKLPQDEWFQHYVNPYNLLDTDPSVVDDNPKAFLKAKQALLREIELEEGKVAWMPGLTIDKSAALALLAELEAPDGQAAHGAVFYADGINQFLCTGSLEHFLIPEDGRSDLCLPYEQAESTLKHIGPKFAAQFDKVLSLAAEEGDLAVVECLVDGRRWVLPVDQEACWAGAKRVMTRKCEPLMKRSKSDMPVDITEVKRVFEQGRLGQLLALLPVEFHEAHSSVGVALRSLSVSFYNRELDAEGAKAFLELGRSCADKSPALAHQFAEDLKTLDGFIKEEKAKETFLTFGDTSLSITKAGVVYGNRRLGAKDIAGLRWGLVVTVERPRTTRHTIAFEAVHGPDLEVTWTTSSDLDKQKDFWSRLVDAAFEYLLPSVMETFQNRLDQRELTRVGGLLVAKNGVELTAKGWFFDKQVLVEWHNLRSTISNGSVVLVDISNPKATASLPIEQTYNAILLHLMANRKKD